MSDERKFNRITEFLISAGKVLTAFSIPVTVAGVIVSMNSTEKSINAQEILLRKSIAAQEELLERETQMQLASAAYTSFLNELIPGTEGKVNTRIPIALFGSKETREEFLRLEGVAKERGNNLNENPELQQALLSFLRTVSAHIVGKNNAPDEQEIRSILDIQ